MAEDRIKAWRARSIAFKALRDRHRKEFECYIEYLFDLTEDQFIRTKANDLPEYEEISDYYGDNSWDKV